MTIQHAPRTTARDLVRRTVATQVQRLQREYLPSGTRTVPTSWAAATLATLRRPDGTAGASLAIWNIVLSDLPDELVGRDDQPSDAERAVRLAVVLYAVHQHSRTVPMHIPDRPFGQSVRDLAARRGSPTEPDPGVLRRFQRAATADAWERRSDALHAIVQLLRSEQIPMDYADFAVDLYRLQRSSERNSVLLRWARGMRGATGVTSEPGSDGLPGFDTEADPSSDS